jgi:hypothetical protein
MIWWLPQQTLAISAASFQHSAGRIFCLEHTIQSWRWPPHNIQSNSVAQPLADERERIALVIRQHEARLCALDLPPAMVQPARAAIAQILARQIDTALRDGPVGGCLLVNSAVELAQHDPEVARRVQRDLADAEALFATLLSADPAFVGSGRDAQAVARLLVNVSIGLRVQAKITPDRAALEDIVAVALTAVG